MENPCSGSLRRVVAGFVVLALVIVPSARAVVIPEGTPVYRELDEQVTSKKKETTVGDIVRARVWRDVVVDGRIVIRAGTPMLAKVSMVKPAKMAGRKGDVHIQAVSTRAVDRTEVYLDGGYDKSGKGRKAAAWSLFALVAWPLVFLKGKQAILDPGTVFDAVVMGETRVEPEEGTPVRLQLGGVLSDSLEAEILYDEMDPEAKNVLLPVHLRKCGNDGLASANIVSVNGAEVDALPLTISAASSQEGCEVAVGRLDLKELAKHFKRGINRFEVEVSKARAELVLDIEF